MANDDDKIRLQVAAAKPEDVGKGIARVAGKVFRELDLSEGDMLELVGKRTTGALAVEPYAEDEGLDLIRLDGLQRANADVSISDPVEVRKADAKPARKVTLAPAQRNVRLQGPGEALRRTLHGTARHLWRRRLHVGGPETPGARLRPPGDPSAGGVRESPRHRGRHRHDRARAPVGARRGHRGQADRGHLRRRGRAGRHDHQRPRDDRAAAEAP